MHLRHQEAFVQRDRGFLGYSDCLSCRSENVSAWRAIGNFFVVTYETAIIVKLLANVEVLLVRGYLSDQARGRIYLEFCILLKYSLKRT